MIRIKELDSNLVVTRLDGGGIPIYNYKGKPLTGIIYGNRDDGSLSWEQEYKEGLLEGKFTSYHRNGAIKRVYESHNNITLDGTYKEWDEEGNLIVRSEVPKYIITNLIQRRILLRLCISFINTDGWQ